MPVLHDYECLAHGRFESFKQECPYGCQSSFVKVIHLKAPGFITDRTKGIDKTLVQLAGDFGMTDMNNQNGTGAARRVDPQKVKEHEQLMGKLGDTSDKWGAVNPGGTYQVGKGAVPVEGRSGGGAVSTITGTGVLPGDASTLQNVSPLLVPPKANVVGRYDAEIK